MQAHRVQSPGEGGSPWGSRTVLLKPRRAGPPADERGAPRGPSPAPCWGDGCTVTAEAFTFLYLKWFKTSLNCP